jgi:hypothetical protein
VVDCQSTDLDADVTLSGQHKIEEVLGEK